MMNIKLLHGDCLELMKDIPEEIKRRTDMREIKFRAWDKVNKKVRKVMSLDFYNTRQSEVTLASDGDVYLRYFEQVELMQYTGLKDKNGTEIYEGDILGKTFHLDLFVRFQNGKFMLYDTNLVRRNNDYTYDLYRNVVEGYCVIGNIFENPELIER